MQMTDRIRHRSFIRRNIVFGYLAPLYAQLARVLCCCGPCGDEIRVPVESQKPQDPVSYQHFMLKVVVKIDQEYAAPKFGLHNQNVYPVDLF